MDLVNLGMAWKKPSVGHDLVYILKKSSFYAISSYVGVNVSLRGAVVLCSVSRFITPKGLAIHPTIIDYFAPANAESTMRNLCTEDVVQYRNTILSLL